MSERENERTGSVVERDAQKGHEMIGPVNAPLLVARLVIDAVTIGETVEVTDGATAAALVATPLHGILVSTRKTISGLHHTLPLVVGHSSSSFLASFLFLLFFPSQRLKYTCHFPLIQTVLLII